MKNSLPYILILAIAFIVYQLLNPNKIVETKTEYIKGDSVIIVKADTIYLTKNYYSKIVDTVYETVNEGLNEGIIIPKTDFIIDNDTSGVKGKVSFNKDRFSFSDIKFWFPVTEILRVDTLKITQSIEKPLLTNHWFYTTILSLALLIALVLK